VVQEWEDSHPGEPLPDYFVDANSISVEEHIYMMAAVQKYIDSSISKTLNAPNSHTVDDVEKAYTLAYDCGLKSVAYFRDGCGRAQVLTKEPEKKEAPVAKTTFSRANSLSGTTQKIITDIGTAFITVNRSEDGRPVEVFVNVGKAGSDVQELSESIGRLISINLQNDVKPNAIIGQMLGIGGYSKFRKSLPTAIAMALSEDAGQPAETQPSAQPVATGGRTGSLCPICKSFSLLHEEGCLKCATCAYSAC
jgi:ribonucleoside-diphosphate reductase alpha chain